MASFSPPPIRDIEDLDLTAVYYAADDAKTLHGEMMAWYGTHRRRLPWRGDAPPFTDESESSKLPSKKKRKTTAAAARPAGVPAISSFFSCVGPLPAPAAAAAAAPAAAAAALPSSMCGPLTVSPYATWVSEVMLQQTRVATVIAYHTKWMQLFPTVEALAAASEEEVNAAWAGLGFYRRVRSLHKGAKQVVAEHNGEVPSTTAALEKLAGVGPYTAGAIASIAFGRSAALVDGNVIRVLARHRALHGDAKSRNLAKLCWRLARELVPERDAGIWNQALMELGATVCTPKSPSCAVCPIRASCRGVRSEGGATRFPFAHVKPKPRDEGMAVCAVRRKADGRLLCQRRPLTGLLAGQWQLLCAVVAHDPPPTLGERRAALVAALEATGERGAALRRLVACEEKRDDRPGLGRRRDISAKVPTKHTFSHIKHHMFIEAVELDEEAAAPLQREEGDAADGDHATALEWMNEAELKTRGVTAGLKKVLKQLAREKF